MPEEYITMNDEIMRQKWVITGPLLELCVLSLVTKPKKWRYKFAQLNKLVVKENISREHILENRYQFMKNIISKIEEIKTFVEIIEDRERIENEIKLLNENELINKNKTRIIDIKIFINIGYKRQGRMMIEIINDDIILIKMMYDDYDYNFKYKKELKKLLNKMIKLFNGICGSISHENTLSSIIKADQLLYNNNIYGFYNIKWNHNVHTWCRTSL